LKYRRLNKWHFITPISLILFVAALFFIKSDPNFIVAIIISVSLHEAAHGLLITMSGLKFNTFFVPFLGAGVIPSETSKYLSLSKLNRALIAIAGPFVNLILFFVGLALVWYVPGYSIFGMQLANINLALVVINMTPFVIFDGFKIASTVIHSLNNIWLKVTASFYFSFFTFLGLFFLFQKNGSVTGKDLIWIISLYLVSALALYIFSIFESESKSMTKLETLFILIMFTFTSSISMIWLYLTLFF